MHFHPIVYFAAAFPVVSMDDREELARATGLSYSQVRMRRFCVCIVDDAWAQINGWITNRKTNYRLHTLETFLNSPS